MTGLIEFPKPDLDKDITIVDNGISFDFDDDVSFDFDDDISESDSYIDSLYEIEKLHRMIGKGDYKTFYILKTSEIESKQISLFNLNHKFLTNNGFVAQSYS